MTYIHMDKLTPPVYKTAPFDHQRESLETMGTEKYWALFWEMGTGKTKVVIDNITLLYSMGKIQQALILAPKGMYHNWCGEIETHMLSDCYYHMYRSGARKKERKDLEYMIQHRGLRILIMNIEAMRSKKAQAVALGFIKGGETLICCDESTTIKNPKAIQTKVATRLAKKCTYRRILSGTPITQSPLDLYSQTEFLKPQLLEFKNFFQFKHFYTVVQQIRMGNRAFSKIVGYQNLPHLRESIVPFSSRIRKGDCMDLPPKVYQTVHVELTDMQRKAYDTFKEQAIYEFEQGCLTSTSALTTIGKLHQILCGQVIDDDGNLIQLTTNRPQALLDICEIYPGKIVVWCNYRGDVVRLLQVLEEHEIGAVPYYGAISHEHRIELLESWRKPNGPRVLVATAATGGMGLTLVESHVEVFYSNGYRLDVRLQAEDRLHRHGQQRSVTIVDLVVPHSLDEKIIEALHRKENLAEEILSVFPQLLD